eukprot:10431430-Alexandrium_andersonii.AAC.1
MDPEAVAEGAREALAHLEVVVKLHRARVERGAHFPRGRPAIALSWNEQGAQDLLGDPGVGHGVGH